MRTLFPADHVLSVLARLTDIAESQDQYIRRKQDADRDTRFKINRVIPKITAETGTKLLDELDDFEVTFARTYPRSAKEWALTLDDSLTGKAQTWRDFVILTYPGRDFFDRMQSPLATTEDFSNYYRFIRGELMSRSGLDKENPGEATKAKWQAIKFPDHVKHQEDLDDTLDTIVSTYKQLVRHGLVVADHEEDE